MNQRGFAWPALLMSALPYILMLITAGSAWWFIDRNCWTTACRVQASRADIAEGRIVAAQERATALALLWAKSIEQVEKIYVDRVEVRTVRIAGVREAARSVHAATDAVPVPVPASARRVLGDAERFANAEDPAAPAIDPIPAETVPQAADSTLTEWITFAVDAAESYRDSRDKWAACVIAYESVQQASASTNPEQGE